MEGNKNQLKLQYIKEINPVSVIENQLKGQTHIEHNKLSMINKEMNVNKVNVNSFIGSLPDCLKNCSRLSRVRLQENQFNGSISAAFGIHPKLYYISMNDNKFVGALSPK